MAFLFQRLNDVTIEEVRVSDGEEVLDVGCGRAIDIIRIAKGGVSCCGLEPSKRMINYAKERINESGIEVGLVQGIGEYLPFKDCSLDKVVCKGALDHFPHPAKATEEIARVLKPHGKAIFTIANFESLGFRLGKRLFARGNNSDRKKMWEIPSDHTHKFDYRNLKSLVEHRFRVEKAIGVSLLFGLPGWSSLLSRLPKSVSSAALNILDKIAHRLPSLSDAVILRCSPKPVSECSH